MININNISKSFKNKNETKEVLRDISFDLEFKNIYLLLGRNGVGKTTLLKTISRRVKEDKGSINYNDIIDSNNNLNMACHYDCIDFGNYASYYGRVKELITSYKNFLPNFNLEYAFELLNKFKIDNNAKVRKLSLAQKNIITVVATLASNQKVLFFDEPVQLLSTELRDTFYKELIEVSMNNEQIIVVSSHIISEIENIANKVLILKDSELVINDDIEELKTKYNQNNLEEIFMKVVG